MGGVSMLVVLVIAGLLALVIAGLIMARLYQKATKEISFVRTGLGGQKVIMNGGSLVLPVLHEIIPVNMNTLRLEVRRANEQALITKDRMRVDVQAEFYVRVQPSAEAIADAAQTLGIRTMKPDLLKELVEGKFVDALRAVAAEMAMEELHEQRVDFVQKVQLAVSEDLLKNGLELESVSLTALDQTDESHFNPQNAFDAQGLTKLTEEIQARRKQRNDIERDTEIAIKQKDLTSEKQRLEIDREEEYARLSQTREIEIRRAEQKMDIEQQRAEKERLAEESKITAGRQVAQAKIEAEREVERARIDREQTISEQTVLKNKAIELAEQDREIAIAQKSEEKSRAKAEADKALAEAVRAEERVTTAKEAEIAERNKAIELVEAAKIAERSAIGVTVAAEAEKQAALDQAEAIRLKASGEAEAERLRAEAAEIRYQVDAAGKRSLNEAANAMTPELIAYNIKIALIENLDKIIRESVRPMEAIEGIKIVQVGGMNPGPAGSDGTARGDGNLADSLVNSALRYRAQAPLLDSLLQEVGLNGGDINGFTAGFNEAAATKPAPAQPKAPKGEA